MVKGVDGRTGVVAAPVAVNALNAAEAGDDTRPKACTYPTPCRSRQQQSVSSSFQRRRAPDGVITQFQRSPPSGKLVGVEGAWGIGKFD